MAKRKSHRSYRTWCEIAIHTIGLVCTVGVFALAVLQLLGFWKRSSVLYLPLTALLMLVQAYEHRKRNRKLAIFSLVAGIFVGICWLLILFI